MGCSQLECHLRAKQLKLKANAKPPDANTYIGSIEQSLANVVINCKRTHKCETFIGLFAANEGEK